MRVHEGSAACVSVEPVADICTTPGCTEKKNPAEQVCFYCKQGRTGHIDEAMAGSSISL